MSKLRGIPLQQKVVTIFPELFTWKHQQTNTENDNKGCDLTNKKIQTPCNLVILPNFRMTKCQENVSLFPYKVPNFILGMQ